MIMIKSRRPSVHLQFHNLTVGSSVTFENGSTTLEMNVHSAPRAPPRYLLRDGFLSYQEVGRFPIYRKEKDDFETTYCSLRHSRSLRSDKAFAAFFILILLDSFPRIAFSRKFWILGFCQCSGDADLMRLNYSLLHAPHPGKGLSARPPRRSFNAAVRETP